MDELAPGTSWGTFQIDRPVGRGPTGTVYRAAQSPGGRPVGLKILHDDLDDATLARFEDDTRRVIGLNHPHVLRVEATGREGRRLFIVTEAFDGRPLQELGPRPLREGCEIFLKVARGLGAAWMRLILHRNLKPENILVSPQGEVRVADFGLFRGPTPYWSPERKAGQSADMRSDLFAFGTIFREFLAEHDPQIDALIHHLTRVETFERVQMVEDAISRLEAFLSRTAGPAAIAAPAPSLYVPVSSPSAFPTAPTWDPPAVSRELKEARASMVSALGAVTHRLQRTLVHRAVPPPPPPARPVRPEVQLPPPAPPDPLPPAPPRGRPKKSSGKGVFVMILILLGIGVSNYFRHQGKLLREPKVDPAEQVREAERAERMKRVEEEIRRSMERAREPLPGVRVEEEWSRAKDEIWKLHDEAKTAQAIEVCDRFIAKHGTKAPPESRQLRTELRSWMVLVQQAENARRTGAGKRALDFLERGGPSRAKDKERLLARWCEEDWTETAKAVDRAVAQSDPASAKDALDRFLKGPHDGGARRKEAETRSLQFQADVEFAEVLDRTESLLRGRKPADATAAWELYLNQPHRGGTHREEAGRRLAAIKEELRQTVYSGVRPISRLALSADGKKVAFSADRLRVIDVATREELWSQPLRSLLRGIAFAGGTTLAVTPSNQVTLWDLSKKEEFRTLTAATGYLPTMAVSRDGKRLIATHSDGSLVTWDLDKEGPPRVDKDAATGIALMVLSADGLKVALGARDKTIRVRELPTGLERKWAAASTALAWSPDGTLLASTSGEEVTVWNAGTGDVVQLLRGHKGLVSCVAFSADGTRLASGGSDKVIRLWSVKDGTSAGQLPGHRDRVTILLPMPGGGLMSASADGSVRTWSTAD